MRELQRFNRALVVAKCSQDGTRFRIHQRDPESILVGTVIRDRDQARSIGIGKFASWPVPGNFLNPQRSLKVETANRSIAAGEKQNPGFVDGQCLRILGSLIQDRLRRVNARLQ